MVRAVVRMVVLLICLHGVGQAVVAVVWWSLDSGPLAQQPRLVLTERSEAGAIRVYGDHPDVDLTTAAELTVDDLAAAGGFDRDVLVVALPTGSGWVDPAQVLALERRAGGDVATVSLRYSAAPSAVVYLVRPSLAVHSARALLSAVTDRLAMIPPADRPSLIVHGQSLGALAGARALEDRSVARYVDARLWQGRPGVAAPPEVTTPPAVEACTVSAINPDDPVAALTLELLLRPRDAVRVLTTLPGSASARPGSLHNYTPITAPPGCVA